MRVIEHISYTNLLQARRSYLFYDVVSRARVYFYRNTGHRAVLGVTLKIAACADLAPWSGD